MSDTKRKLYRSPAGMFLACGPATEPDVNETEQDKDHQATHERLREALAELLEDFRLTHSNQANPSAEGVLAWAMGAAIQVRHPRTIAHPETATNLRKGVHHGRNHGSSTDGG